MTVLPSSIALHIGAHKTASTHLQRSLAEAKLANVRIVGPTMLRDPGQTLPERFGFPLDPSESATGDVDVGQVLADLAGGADRLVISDENFAGKLQTGWGRVPTPVYPAAAKRLTRLTSAIQSAGGPELELFLCIRSPADYLTSVYSQVLHGGRRVRPEVFVAKNSPSDIDWAAYAVRLRDAAGIGQLTIWRYEDYAELFNDITTRLTGQTDISPVAERTQERLSPKALDGLMQAKSTGLKLSATEAAKAFPRSASEAGFEIYDPNVRARADADYVRQWDHISKLPGITQLTLQRA